MKPITQKQKAVGIMVMIVIILILSITPLVGLLSNSVLAGGNTFGGNPTGTTTAPTTSYPQNPFTHVQTTTTSSSGKFGSDNVPRYLYLSMYPVRAWIGEEIFGTVTCDLHNIDLVVYYNTFGGGGGVLSAPNNNPNVEYLVYNGYEFEPVLTSFSIDVHIGENGSGYFSLILDDPDTWYFMAYYMGVQSNTVQVDVMTVT